MGLHFTGPFEELKTKLGAIPGEWRELSPSQKQFRATAGGILNWYPANGTLMFQGKSPAVESLEATVKLAVESKEAGHGVARDPATAVVLSVPVATPPSAISGTAPSADAGLLRSPFNQSELVFGLIGAVGAQLDRVRSVLEERLRVIGYDVQQIRITEKVIPVIEPPKAFSAGDEYARINSLMDAGDDARLKSGDNSILALGAAAFINSLRGTETDGQPKHKPKRAYIISALKHPAEVQRLREIYAQGFYLIGIHADEKRRFDYLTVDRRIPDKLAIKLMERDEDENLEHGQRLIDAFHLSDFFVRLDGHDDQLKFSLWRILDLLFGAPYVTPTFDEYAMFLAFAASLRSADLSRQVGAVVSVGEQVVSTGANDCPKAGGGLYWPQYNSQSHQIEDQADGRDYMRLKDSNKAEQAKIIDEIVAAATEQGLDGTKLKATLEKSRIRDLTEFGRVVHAEMEALLSCARAEISASGGTVYTTTFPCHNCAKHIVAAGIARVVFIEPYRKSKAPEFHTDSIEVGFLENERPEEEKRQMVRFEPFVGVGPRRFFDLFSVRLGSGYPVKRKTGDGHIVEWKPENSRLRLQMLPVSYLDLELVASAMFNKASKTGSKAGTQ